MPLPQELSLVTLGARDLPALRSFYRSLGWDEAPGSSDDYASFVMGSVKLALYPIELLRDEAAPAGLVPPAGHWSGFALAVNVADRQAVDRAFDDAVAAGAVAVATPRDREWGGYSGYVADPEGNRWELAWAPS